MNKFFIIVVFIFVVCGQESMQISLENYTAQGFDENSGEISWKMKGDKAIALGDKYKLTNAVITFFEKYEQQVLTTVSCLYNINSKVSSSSEGIHFSGKNFDIVGKGFDINNEEKSIYIRSEVEVIWVTK